MAEGRVTQRVEENTECEECEKRVENVKEKKIHWGRMHKTDREGEHALMCRICRTWIIKNNVARQRKTHREDNTKGRRDCMLCGKS